MRATAAASLLVGALALGAACTCDKVIEGATAEMVKMIRASGEITAQLKVQAHVGVSVEQGGRVVTVKLQRPPAEKLEQARPKIEAIVRKHIANVREVRVSADL